ncbi:hypothetical protein HK104_006850 [Borealophlyctis nickersoniae]|nr:hypothetical protein HK104_006850 [Borealophlyctis nickersoniae]
MSRPSSAARAGGPPNPGAASPPPGLKSPGQPQVQGGGGAIVKKPGFGQLGTKFKVTSLRDSTAAMIHSYDRTDIQVKANFFPLTNIPGKTIYHWEVSVSTPQGFDVKDLATCRKCVMAWAEQKSSPLFKKTFVYDGMHIMYTPMNLERESYEAEVVFEDNSARAKDGKRNLNVEIKRVAEVDMNRLVKAINGQTLEVPQECIQVLNVVLGHYPSANHFTVGRAFYPLSDPSAVSILANSDVQLNVGYRASIRPTKGRVLLNIDMANTLTYKPGPLMDIISKIGGFPLNNRDATLNMVARQNVNRFITGLKVSATYGTIKRSYRIYSLSKDSVTTTYFTTDDGKKYSVADYFKETYNYIIKYRNLPCFNSFKDSTQSRWIPLECVNVDEKQLYRKTLDMNQSRDMINITCQPPKVRAAKIMDAFHRIQSPVELLKEFSIDISSTMMTVDARMLDVPLIVYNKASKAPEIRPVDGAWNLRDKKMVAGSTLQNWAVIAFADERVFPRPAVENFVKQMVNTCNNTGLNITNARPTILCEPSAARNPASIAAVIKHAMQNPAGRPQIIMCLLPNMNNIPIYNAIKLVTDTLIGIPSQCIQEKHVRAANLQYCANVCMKLNLKLGGVNAQLGGKMTWVSAAPTMVVGADVSHPGFGDKGMPSIAAVVGSINSTCSFYRSSLRVQDSGQESLWQLAPQMEELLRAFIKQNGRGPDRILFYRDGVSEGEFDLTSKTEVNSVLAACEKIKSGWRPRITYVACQKRHRARFFPEDVGAGDAGPGGGGRGGGGDRGGFRGGRGGGGMGRGGGGAGADGIKYPFNNVPPGTVVDSGVTHPTQFDFLTLLLYVSFMCSHAGLKGTSRPVHYHVLRDDNGVGADQLQTLTYELCYLYGKATRSVSVVTPVYYAHIVAKRARCWFSAITASDITAASPDPSNSAAAGQVMPKLHPNLEGSMWFM